MTRDEIVQVSIRLLNEGGLVAVSLRKVAAELGVQAPALYWHVRNKRELLDLMAEEIVSEVALPPEPAAGQPWWDWLTERTRAAYGTLRTHRDSALVVAGNRPTWRSLPQIEQQLSALVEVGFPPGEALQAMLTLGAFVLGSALEEQSEAARPHQEDARRHALWAELQATSRLPTLAAAMGELKHQGGPEGFEYGLRLLILSFRLRLAELQAAAAGSAPPVATVCAAPTPAVDDVLVAAVDDALAAALADLSGRTGIGQTSAAEPDRAP